MLTKLNRYCHGYVILPPIIAFKQRGVIDKVGFNRTFSMLDITDYTSINTGHLSVIFRSMTSLGWITQHKGDMYQFTESIRDVECFPDDICDLLKLDIDTCLTHSQQVELINSALIKANNDWNIRCDKNKHQFYVDLLDGLLVIPLILSMNRHHLKKGSQIIWDKNFTISKSLISDFFQLRGWGKRASEDIFELSPAGEFIFNRMLNAGTVASYAPMLRQSEELLFGNSKKIFERDPETGHEGHIDRRLNVIASGFQHDKYFKEIDALIISLFDREPLSEQPSYICDMGCGDGTLLKRIYETVKNKTRRGEQLNQFPLLMVGADYNEKALEATRETLVGVPHMTIKGDIGDPLQLEIDLKEHVNDVKSILHIRSFLDHDRPFKYPQQNDSRSGLQYYKGVFVDNDGELIPSATAHQSLVEHLRRWADIESQYGIIILEVHAMAAEATASYIDESENLHFDAYHGFSKQYLVEADAFLMCAAYAGLIPNVVFGRKFPKVMDYSRITLNHFLKKQYSIRHVSLTDIDELIAIEHESLCPVDLRTTKERLTQRVNTYPKGQYVLTKDQTIIAALYSQRVIHPSNDEGSDAFIEVFEDQPLAPRIELLYCLCRDQSSVNDASELVEFVEFVSRVKNEVTEVVGQARCLNYLKQYTPKYIAEPALCTKPENHNLTVMINQVKNKILIDPNDDTLPAELELELFGARLLLTQLRKLGILVTPNESMSIKQLQQKAGIIDTYTKLFKAILALFDRHEILKISGENITLLSQSEHFFLKNEEHDIVDFRTNFLNKYPSFSAYFNLVMRTLSEYHNILSGVLTANDVVFNEGSLDLFSRIFKGNAVEDYFNSVIAGVIAAKTQAIRENSSEKTVRILEIGAGTGGCSEVVLANLAKTIAGGNTVSFYYTDISSSFTRYGESKFAHLYPWVKFERFDITKDIDEQGFQTGSFDVVFASNVLHDTPVILETIKRANALLAEDGLLIINEYSVSKDVLLFSGALLHGYWLFEDHRYRLPNTCLLSSPLWESAFKESGLLDVQSVGLPWLNSNKEFRQCVVVGRKSADYPVTYNNYSSTSQQLESFNVAADKLVGDRVVATVDIGQSDIDSVCEKIADMMKAIVGNHRMASFSLSLPFMEIGLDSLELVELRVLINKKLNIKLESSALFDYTTVTKLATHIVSREDYNNNNIGERKFEPIPETSEDPRKELKQQSANSVNTENAKQPLDADKMLYLGLIEEQVEKIVGKARMANYCSTLPFMELGLDSLELVELRVLLGKKLAKKFESSVLFEHNTAEKLSLFLMSLQPVNNASVVQKVADISLQQEVDSSSLQAELQASVNNIEAQNINKTNDIAIVGLSFKFPNDIENIDELWNFLAAGDNAISELSDSIRLEGAEFFQDKRHALMGGYLSAIDGFDAPFFRLSPREVELMDPQQRLMLELTWRLFENAGYSADSFKDSNTGVYIGACHFDYRNMLARADNSADAYVATGTSGSILANRLSYFYNLTGPSVAVDTACSSSLVALHNALQAIQNGECEQALVGGVNLICSLDNNRMYDRADMLSKSGFCRTFDAQADGYVRGEGAGLILIKPLTEAEKQGDNIYAVIKGSAINHGGQATSLTAPNPSAHARLIRQALDASGVTADTVSYIEAHGTGTPLGDPIELAGLKKAFAKDTNNQSFCGIGSIKPSIGHLEGAAGIAGLIKVLACLRHQQLPPSINFQSLNPEISINESPFYVVDQLRDWSALTNKEGTHIPRRCGISSFGFGGANGHVILEEYASDTYSHSGVGNKSNGHIHGEQYHLFLLSAASNESLHGIVKKYCALLRRNALTDELKDICFTLMTSRNVLSNKVAVVIKDKQELLEKLESYLSGKQMDLLVNNDSSNTALPIQSLTRLVKTLNIHCHSSVDELASLSMAWVNGYQIEQQQFYPDTAGFLRVRLPEYCFDHQSYWLVRRPSQNTHIESITAGDTPFNDTRLGYSGREHIGSKKNGLEHAHLENSQSENSVKTSLTGQEFFLTNHIIDDQKILPGVFYLELAIQANNHIFSGKTTQITNVNWVAPLTVSGANERQYKNAHAEMLDSEAVNVETTCVQSGQHNTFEVLSGQQIRHCFGEVSDNTPLVNEFLPKAKNEFDQVLSECFIELSKNQCYKILSDKKLQYGSEFQGIEKLNIGHREAIAKIKLPESLLSDFEHFLLHPSLMDSILQAAVLLGVIDQSTDNSSPLMPFSMTQLNLFDSLEGEFSAHIRYCEDMPQTAKLHKFDIFVFSTKGKLIMSMSEICLLPGQPDKGLLQYPGVDTKVSNKHSLDKINDSSGIGEKPLAKKQLAEIKQVEKSEFISSASDEQKFKCAIPVWREKGLNHTIQTTAQNLPQTDFDVIIVADQEVGQQWDIPSDLKQLYTFYSIPFRLDEFNANRTVSKVFLGLQEKILGEINQHIAKPDNNKCLVIVMCSGIQTIPIQKSISAYLKTATKEFSDIFYTSIYIEPEWLNSKSDITQIALNEINHCQTLLTQQVLNFGVDVRYSKVGQRHILHYQDITDDIANKPAIEQDNPGVYWITGGLGGAGMVIAEALAKTQGSKIIVSGRRSSLESFEVMDKLRRTGGHYEYIQCDVENALDTHKVVKTILNENGTLTGVIHCAAVLSDSTIVKQNDNNIEKVWGPKSQGVVNIHHALGDTELNFFILFSSVVSVCGNIGQSAYSSANGFLDGFAEYRNECVANNECHGTTLTINWPIWQDGGMRIEPKTEQALYDQLGLLPMPSYIANSLISTVLQLGSEEKTFSQLVVGYGNPQIMNHAIFGETNTNIDSVKPLGRTVGEVKNKVISPLNTEENLTDETVVYLKGLFANTLKTDINKINVKREFESYGIDSIMVIELTAAMEKNLGKISKTLFFEYNTLEALAKHISSRYKSQLSKLFQQSQSAHQNSVSEEEHLSNTNNFRQNNTSEAVNHSYVKEPRKTHFLEEQGFDNQKTVGRSNDIAIIGLSGRYPGATNLDEFWKNLASGRDSITEIPADRWDLTRYFSEDKSKAGHSYSKWGGFLDNVDKFDCRFFGISPRDAEIMDPQERLFLETVWQTLEDAAYTRHDFVTPTGLKKVGVYVGVMYQEYQLYGAQAQQLGAGPALSGNPASIANRISYYCGFNGPSMAVDTMCSSSLTAIHLACESLLSGECEYAVAGGVNVSIHPNKYIFLSQGRFASSKGRCESFGEGGDGYVPGEGVGAVLLKPLARAIEDDDHIYGVIKSSAINHGGKTNGYTVPNPNIQADVIKEAIRKADINPNDISYIEAHGTGTSLGDPIEIAGLTRAFNSGDNETDGNTIEKTCVIGSVKSNIGHCESAAGMAGITKILLQMKNRQLVPSIHSSNLNEKIDFDSTPFTVQQNLEYWEKGNNRADTARIAGISSFGAGGANAHLILEEYQASDNDVFEKNITNNEGAELNQKLFLISAKTETALRQKINDLLIFIQGLKNEYQNKESTFLCNLSCSLMAGREPMKYRFCCQSYSLDHLIHCLKLYLPSGERRSSEYHVGYSGQDKDWLDESENDPILLRAIHQHVMDEKWTEIIPSWCNGIDVNWSEYLAGQSWSRLSLPVYPFEGKRYWISDNYFNKEQQSINSKSTVSVNNDGSTKLHPLVHRKVPVNEPGHRYSSFFSMSDRVIKDHVVSEKPILAGVCFLEMVDFCLKQERAVLSNFVIDNVFWFKPFNVDNESLLDRTAELYIESRQQGGMDITLHKQGGLNQPNATCTVNYENIDLNEKKKKIISLNDIIERMDQRVEGSDLYEQFSRIGLNYGRSFQGIKNTYYNSSEIFSELVLDEYILNDSKAYRYFPGILDSALQSIFVLLDPKVTYVPYSLKQFCGISTINSKCFAHIVEVTQQKSKAIDPGIKRFNIEFYSPQGKLLGAMQELCFRALKNSAGGDDQSNHGYQNESSAMPSENLTQDSTLDKTSIVDRIKATLTQHVKTILKMDGEVIAGDEELEALGFESVTLTELSQKINDEWELNVTPTLFFQYHTLNKLAEYLYSDNTEKMTSFYQALESLNNLSDNDVHRTGVEPLIGNANPTNMTVSDVSNVLNASSQNRSHDVAIIGIDGVFPGAKNTDAFWQNLIEGKDCISEIPEDRWDWREYFGDPSKDKKKTNSKWGGFIEDVDKFDAPFFKISTAEAEYMDPQHRLFLQSVWHCIEDAGYAASYFSEKQVGVFVGAQFQDYQDLLSEHDVELTPHVGTGTAHSVLANRISYFLNLRGPSEAIDTACSSSLVAIHRAVKAIQTGEIDYAIAGGISLALSPKSYLFAGQMGVFSDDGKCKTFDKSANGYVKGEGLGCVLIKPLDRAIVDGDAIYAVVKGSAENHSGKSQSLTAPNPVAQAELLVKAYKKAGISPDTVGYIETHGTGTALGDPIEIDGLHSAFKQLQERFAVDVPQKNCALGAVKTNIGHLEPAAGMAGILKLILCLKHKKIPPTIHQNERNPYINFSESPFYIVDKPQIWQPFRDGQGNVIPRRAGVSSFGFGGSNAHIVVEEFNSPVIEQDNSHAPVLIVLSAKTKLALITLQTQLKEYILSHSDGEPLDLSSIAYTLQVGRETFGYRVAFIVSSLTECIDTLSELIKENNSGNGLSVESSHNIFFADPDGVNISSDLNDLRSLALRWVNGAKVDWQKYYTDQNIATPTRTHLPGYTFNKQRYWFDSKTNNPNSEKKSSTFSLKKNKIDKESAVIEKTVIRNTDINTTQKTDKEKIFSGYEVWKTSWESSGSISQLNEFQSNEYWNSRLNKQNDTIAILDFSGNHNAENCLSKRLHASLSTQQWRSIYEYNISNIDIRDAKSLDVIISQCDAFSCENQFLKGAKGQTPLVLCTLPSSQHLTNSADLLIFSTHLCQAILKEWDFACRILFFSECESEVNLDSRDEEGRHGLRGVNAALTGFVNTLNIEEAKLSAKIIELSNVSDSSAESTQRMIHDDLANIVYNEWHNNESEHLIRYSQAQRFVSKQKLDSTYRSSLDSRGEFLDPSDEKTLTRGVYLITGGLGGLGKIFAHYLLENTDNHAYLIGRRSKEESGVLDFIKENDFSGRLYYAQVDVSIQKDVIELVKNIEKKHGQLNGVIHSAGVIRDKIIRNKHVNDIDTVCQVKLDGIKNLDLATQYSRLDFFMAFSSLAAIRGNFGQSSYAFANNYMDIFCENRNQQVNISQRHGISISINWPYWLEGGLTVEDKWIPRITEMMGHPPLSNEQGLDIFEIALSLDHGGSFYPFPTSIQPDQYNQSKYKTIDTKRFSSTENVTIKSNAVNDVNTSAVDSLSAVTQYLVKVLESTLKNSIDVDATFDSMGVESFTSVKILADLESHFGELRKTLLFEYTNIDTLAHYFVDSYPDQAKDLVAKTESDRSSQVQSEPVQDVPLHDVESQSTELDNTNELTNTLNNEETLERSVDINVEWSRYLTQIFEKILKQPVDPDSTFDDIGVDSFNSVKVLAELEKIFGELRKTLLFEYNNLDSLSVYFLDNHNSDVVKLINQETVSEITPEKNDLPGNGISDNSDSEDVDANNEQGIAASLDIKDSKSKCEENIGGLVSFVQERHYPDQELITRLKDEYGNDAAIAMASQTVTPYLFIDSSSIGFMKAGKRGNVILVVAYVGPDFYHDVLLQKIYSYCDSHDLSLNVLTTRTLNTVNKVSYSSTPFGALQEIHNIQDFSLEGKKMRRLRQAYNKFSNTGDGEAKTEQYHIGRNDQIDKQIVELIDIWMAAKKQVNPSIRLFKQKLISRTLDNKHRIYVTYLNDVMENVIVLSKMHNAFLMDLEFYSPEGTYGGLEYAIVEIIKLLREEEETLFSMGATHGPEIEPSPNADDDVRNILETIRKNNDFGAGNLQFKNKFRPKNSVLYLSKPKGGNPGDINDILMMIADPEEPETYTSRFSMDQRQQQLEEFGLNPGRIPVDQIDIDFMSDSWAKVNYPFIDEYLISLNSAKHSLNPSQSVESILKEVFPYEFLYVTESGREAEALLCEARSNQLEHTDDTSYLVLSNCLFPTYLFSQLGNGFKPVEIPCGTLFSDCGDSQFKGNLDLQKTKDYLNQHSGKVAFICVELANNAAGGCAVALNHLEQLHELADAHDVPLVLDATRILQNAMMCQLYEESFSSTLIWEVVKQFCHHADAITMSLAKGFGVNKGGLVATNITGLANRIETIISDKKVSLDVNLHKLIGAAIKNRDHLPHLIKQQIAQVKKLGVTLEACGVDVLKPISSHCVLIDIKTFEPFNRGDNSVASFLHWLYLRTGIRGGLHNAGMLKSTRVNETVRLAVPLGMPYEIIEASLHRITDAFSEVKNVNNLKIIPGSKTGFGELANVYETGESLDVTAEEKTKEIEANKNISHSSEKDIAIVGVAGRYPQADNVEIFWDNLKNGKDCITSVPDQRWLDVSYLSCGISLDERNHQPQLGGFIANVEKFDHQFFNISYDEACKMDPQERLCIQTCWQALEDAGYTPDSLKAAIGSNKVGVYMGVVWNHYSLLRAELKIDDGMVGGGSLHHSVPNRVSFVMNFSGPSIAVDTACSSSLNALHMACQAIQHGDCDAALVGGVNLDLHPGKQIGLAKKGMLSLTGRCKSFASDADGYIPGEGVGAVLVKRLNDAIADGDHIYALVKGSATNHGGGVGGYAIPNVDAQQEVIEAAIEHANISRDSISYIEAHGTATEMGDSLEVLGLEKIFADSKVKVGSVKSNIGHLEAAAGIASITKTILQIKNQMLVPSIHVNELNSSLKNSVTVSVQPECQFWENTNTTPRRAGVSAFGAGGSNTHIVLEEYCEPEHALQQTGSKKDYIVGVFILSAPSLESLKQYASVILDWILLANLDENEFLNCLYTLQVGRRAEKVRLAIHSSSQTEVIAALKSYLESGVSPSILTVSHVTLKKTEIRSLSTSPEYKALLQQWLSSGSDKQHQNMWDLTSYWLKGVSLDWHNLYEIPHAENGVVRQPLFQRLSLPGFPFVEKHCWLDLNHNSSSLESSLVANNVSAILSENDTAGKYMLTQDKIVSDIIEVWQDVLNIDDVDIDDNFFSLGGDSFSATKVISQLMNKLNINISTSELFSDSTPEKLAESIYNSLGTSVVDENSNTEHHNLTPHQSWFFYRPYVDANRWNLSYVYESVVSLDISLLQQSLNAVFNQHDILSASFYQEGEEWFWRKGNDKQRSAAFSVIDARHISVNDQSQFLARIRGDEHRSLNIETGPLFRLTLVELSNKQVFYVTMHHLCSDFWSLNILLEDFFSVYNQLKNRLPIQLPIATSSSSALAKQSCDVADSESLIHEFTEYWERLPWEKVKALPRDFPDGDNNIGDIGFLNRQLSQNATHILLTEIPRAFNTTTEDILLFVLTELISQWSGTSWMSVYSIHSGRTLLPHTKNLNLVRTMGWVAMGKQLVYPVSQAATIQERFEETCRSLNSIPNDGFGGTLLAHSCSDIHIRNYLRDKINNEIFLNYAGVVEDEANIIQQHIKPVSNLLSVERPEDAGIDPSEELVTLLHLQALINGGKLEMGWMYSHSVYKKETMDWLADEYVNLLELFAEAFSLEEIE